MPRKNALVACAVVGICVVMLTFSTATHAVLMAGGLEFDRDSKYSFDTANGPYLFFGPSGDRSKLGLAGVISSFYDGLGNIVNADVGYTSGSLVFDSTFSLTRTSVFGSFATYKVEGTYVQISDAAVTTPWLFLTGGEGILTWDEVAQIGSMSIEMSSTATAPSAGLLTGTASAHSVFDSNSLGNGLDFTLNVSLATLSGVPSADTAFSGRTVPEPVTISLMALGLVGAGWSARQRARKN